jgi:nucleoside-diphosphate-sugar epimerase
MRIAVAGGAGYIGSVLVPRLLELGHQVRVFDLLWFGNQLPAEAEVVTKGVLEITEDDLAGFDAVVFVAGLSNDPMAEFSPAQNFVENASAPAYLAYTAKRAGVRRFVHGGSCSVYGHAIDQLYDETSPASCDYPYGLSKLQGETSCLQLADDTFSVMAIRKGTVSGYSPRMRLDLVINAMFKSALADHMIVVNNPSIWRPILAIQDAVEGYVCALEARLGISGIFNLGSANHTIADLAGIVAEGVREYAGIDPTITVKNVHDLRNYKVSWEKATRVLGYQPRFTARDIVRELAGTAELFADVDNPRYYNIRTFRCLTEERLAWAA